MPYLTKDELLGMLRERRQLEVVNGHLISGIPYVFRNRPSAHLDFKATLASQLQTPDADICIIGSAKIGFSLDPDKFGTSFSISSDIDTIIVNSDMFDKAWFELYGLGLRLYSLRAGVQNAFHVHRTNNVFYGFIEPNRLPGIVGISAYWFRTLQGLGRIREIADHEVNARLYRTWEHVRAHQLYSLEGITTKYVRRSEK
jgi:hypothetical protein